MRIRVRIPHKTKRKKVKYNVEYNVKGRRNEVKNHLPRVHPVEYGPCDLCGSSEGKLHTGESCQFICDGCQETVRKWQEKEKAWKISMAKARLAKEGP